MQSTKSRKRRTSKRNTSRKPKVARNSNGWERKFMPKLLSLHGNHAKKIFHRLMKKSSTLKSSLKRRSKEYEVKFDISLTQIRNMLYKCYGKKCRYCGVCLDVRNIVCDHIHPLSMGGDSTTRNLQMICKSCNTKKGPLTHNMYFKLLKWLGRQQEELRKYVLRKLAKGDVFK